MCGVGSYVCCPDARATKLTVNEFGDIRFLAASTRNDQ